MDDGLLPDEGIKERVRVRGDEATTPVHTQTHCLGLQSSREAAKKVILLVARPIRPFLGKHFLELQKTFFFLSGQVLPYKTVIFWRLP